MQSITPAISIVVLALGLIGCATQPPTCHQPTAIDMKAMKSVDEQITALLQEVHELEQVRHGFARYYEKEDGTSEWPTVLSTAPHYRETEAFRFDEYAKDREQLRETLKERVILLRLQLQYLKDTLSHER